MLQLKMRMFLMPNPIAKFAPFLIGEYPKDFMDLVNKVTHLEQLSKDQLTVQLWRAYEYGVRKHDGQKLEFSSWSSIAGDRKSVV